MLGRRYVFWATLDFFSLRTFIIASIDQTFLLSLSIFFLNEAIITNTQIQNLNGDD